MLIGYRARLGRSMTNGSLLLLLHAHLPYIRHPEHIDFLEERWLFEATAECYLPLFRMLEGIAADDVPCRLVFSCSPTLLSMWGDPLLQDRMHRYFQLQLHLAECECERTRSEPEHDLAVFYLERFRRNLADYQRWQRDLIRPLVQLHDEGILELWTTAATHGFLPILRHDAWTAKLQIQVGVDTFRRLTGRSPAGFWLPECGFYPGVESLLKEMDCGVTVVESHGILHARPRPLSGVHRPVRCPNGVAVFGRDPDASSQVWSSQTGYPGDPWYREYYRDIGHTLPVEDLCGFPVDGDIRTPTGIKYCRVTGETEDKALYDPERARLKAAEHARHFIDSRAATVREVDGENLHPVIMAPYDAELFGHWWYEGPVFLDQVIRGLANRTDLELATPGDILERNGIMPVAQPSASTWGDKGYHDVWLDDANDWIYPHLFSAAARIRKALTLPYRPDPLHERLLVQALRELMLAQSSDWPFIMKTGTAVDYARKRVQDHLTRINWLLDAFAQPTFNREYLNALETLTPIFPDLELPDLSAGGNI